MERVGTSAQCTSSRASSIGPADNRVPTRSTMASCARKRESGLCDGEMASTMVDDDGEATKSAMRRHAGSGLLVQQRSASTSTPNGRPRSNSSTAAAAVLHPRFSAERFAYPARWDLPSPASPIRTMHPPWPSLVCSIRAASRASSRSRPRVRGAVPGTGGGLNRGSCMEGSGASRVKGNDGSGRDVGGCVGRRTYLAYGRRSPPDAPSWAIRDMAFTPIGAGRKSGDSSSS